YIPYSAEDTVRRVPREEPGGALLMPVPPILAPCGPHRAKCKKTRLSRALSRRNLLFSNLRGWQRSERDSVVWQGKAPGTCVRRRPCLRLVPSWPDLTRSIRTFHFSFVRTAVLASSPILTVSPSMTTSGQWMQFGQSETAILSM